MDDPLETLFKNGYAQILALAHARLSHERAPISTLTLAHELYLNLRERGDLSFATREQFIAYSSRAMRSLLVDMARERIAKKRSAEMVPLTLGADVPDGGGTPEQLVLLDEAMERLGAIDARVLRIAEMRIIMGMQIVDVAQALGLSVPTIKRDWNRAKAYLNDALGSPVE